MPKRRKVPKYAHHKPTGQARVQIAGQTIYLGKYDSPESRVRYEQLVAERQKNPEQKPEAAALTIGALCVAYIGHCRLYYRKNGRETSEISCVQQALRPLVALYGRTLAAQFTPSCLRRVQDEMIRLQWVRSSINRSISRIRQMFKWALSVEALTSPDVLEMLRSLNGLKKGRSGAVEAPAVRAVKRASVDAVEIHIKPVLWAMIRLQLATGMRPGEVRLMRLTDIGRNDDVWEYRPAEHKLEHKHIDRLIFIGQEGQRILEPYLNNEGPERYLFESAAGRPFTKDGYCRAVSRACIRAKVEHWSPNQLRHTAATEIRKRFGLEASRVILGHSSAETTLIYAERDFEAAKSVIRQMG